MLFLTFFLLIIFIGYPVWDHFYMKKVNNNLVHKWRMYGEIVITQWIMVVIFLAYWLATKHSLNSLFTLKNPLISIETEDFLAIGLGFGIVIIILILTFYFSERIRNRLADALADESIQFLIPKTLRERLLFLIVAITAGICEEIIFRGVVLYYLTHIPFDLSIVTIGIISSVLFGIVHLYQGWKGVLQTAYLGAVFFILYVGTGSLWVPIVLHFIIDVKFVFLPNKKDDRHTKLN